MNGYITQELKLTKTSYVCGEHLGNSNTDIWHPIRSKGEKRGQEEAAPLGQGKRTLRHQLTTQEGI